ncbi:MAG: Mov34/MPN/PAD-1 family protein [Candidatus Margulisiibacteriota bacterium]
MFKITERQYHIILKQAQDSFPYEAGGILGGREDTILGVLPIANKAFEKGTQTFSLGNDDLERAYHFLVKHKLEYLGVYHTHPKGIPYPSEQDLAHNQKYLFIIGLRDRYNPELYAWRVEDGRVFREDVKIISDLGVTVIDVNTGQPKMSEYLSREAMTKLGKLIDDWIAGKEPEYPKLEPKNWDASSFSTFA